MEDDVVVVIVVGNGRDDGNGAIPLEAWIHEVWELDCVGVVRASEVDVVVVESEVVVCEPRLGVVSEVG